MFARALALLACIALVSCSRSASKARTEPIDAGPALDAPDTGSADNDELDDAEEEDDEEAESSSGDGAKKTSTRPRRPVRKLSLDAEEIAAIFAKIPRLAELAPELQLFAEPYDVNIVRQRGSSNVEGWTFSAVPVLWTPAGGKPHLVATGKSGKNAFVVALERLDDGSYELASSIIFRNDPGPFVLAYQGNARERLVWTSCWRCSGEGGAVVARDDGQRVVVIHN